MHDTFTHDRSTAARECPRFSDAHARVLTQLHCIHHPRSLRWPTARATARVRRGVIMLQRLAVVALAVVVAHAANAEIINTYDRGYYRGDGFHGPAIHTYLTGNSNGQLYRGWFAFDLAQYDGQNVVGATLRTFVATMSGGPQTVTLFDIETDIGDLTSAAAPGGTVFEDLGTGTDFGSRAFTNADANQYVEYTLNAAGITAINDALGGNFALGARNSAEGSLNRFVYGSSGTANPAEGRVQLILEFGDVSQVIPLPSAAALGAAGLLAIGCRRRRSAFAPRG